MTHFLEDVSVLLLLTNEAARMRGLEDGASSGAGLVVPSVRCERK
jgi:hypothetical protein